jgi:ketosteroid isomerase-like protein
MRLQGLGDAQAADCGKAVEAQAVARCGILARAMSEENVEIVRRGIEAALCSPEPDFATLSTLYHPDHEFISVVDSTLEGGSHRGMDGYRDWLRGVEETVQSRSRLERVTEIDEERVLAITPTRHAGRSSGVPLDEEPMACIVTVRDGTIVRTEMYPSATEALKAVGLAES